MIAYRCRWCLNMYSPKVRDRDAYCSRQCYFANKASDAALNHDKRSAAREAVKRIGRPCVDCGCRVETNVKRCVECIRKKRSEEAKKYLVRKTRGACSECGGVFHRYAAAVYCGERCARKVQRRERRARKRMGDLPVTDPTKVRLRYLIDRDNGKCQICGRKVRVRVVYPNPLSPSVDHILALAKGGTHTLENTQLAHLQCNSVKSDNGGSQLLLIG